MADAAQPGQVPSAEPAGPPPKKSGLPTCLIVGVILVVGGILVLGVGAALVLPALARATERAKTTMCANNLRQLWTLQMTYQVQFGGTKKRMPQETGAAFWLHLTQTSPPIVQAAEMDVFQCPLPKQHAACDYLGPAVVAQDLKAEDPIGADRPGNHGKGGNVLRKDGSITEVLDGEFKALSDKLSP